MPATATMCPVGPTAQTPRMAAFEQRLKFDSKAIDKRAAKEARRLKFYKDSIRRFRLNMDRISIAGTVFEMTGQARIVTWADLDSKGANATKKLVKELRDAAVIRKFGALKAEDCLAKEQAAEEMEE